LSALKSTFFVTIFALAASVRALDEPKILSPEPSLFPAMTRFSRALEILHQHFVAPESLRFDELSLTAVRAMLREADPEAELLVADEVAALAALESPQFRADVGLALALRGDWPVVIAALDNSPAQRAGVISGDEIVAIDGKLMQKMYLSEVARALRGEPRSEIVLQIRTRGDPAPRHLRLARLTPSAPTVSLAFVGHGVAYIRIPQFTRTQIGPLRDALEQAKSQRATALVLDVRNCALGAFDAAAQAAQLFLEKDRRIGEILRSARQSLSTFVADGSAMVPQTVPIFVLVNGGTAAEAEFFAAALQENGRATLVGARTFGRGLIRSTFALDDGSAMLIATARLNTAAGRNIDGVGIAPDIEVEMTPADERVLVSLGLDSVKNARKMEVDAQLSRALREAAARNR
jgi:carboxyl-terminal processing protease